MNLVIAEGLDAAPNHSVAVIFLEAITDSVVRCPKCGFESKERMPADYCLVRYECRNCGYVMTPKKGDCCIFCSYGSVPCPPEQLRPRSARDAPRGTRSG